MKSDTEQLQQAVESLHQCKAQYKERIWVVERFKDETVWEGHVSIFNLKDHPKADKCYAWSSPIKNSTKHKFYAVLHLPPVESPTDAVRAAIASDYKSKQ